MCVDDRLVLLKLWRQGRRACCRSEADGMLLVVKVLKEAIDASAIQDGEGVAYVAFSEPRLV